MTNKVKLPDEYVNGILCEVVESDWQAAIGCSVCAFSEVADCSDIDCASSEREDEKDVIFKVKL